MQSFKTAVLLILTFTFLQSLRAQYSDTTKIVSSKARQRVSAKSLFIPGMMVAYGFTAIENKGLRNFNIELKEEVYAENPHKKISIDNYLQFVPAAAVYGLNAMGIKGEHNFRDRSMIYFMSNIILNTTVHVTKKLSHQLRPDDSDYSSFPSGHTAEAFASAEFMRLEYRNVSPWYGIAGYGIAAATGYLRMYNNKHWFGDVVAGAGVGIASTKLAYWLYQKIQNRLFKNKPTNTIVMPSYQNGVIGAAIVHNF
jgi:membrane-associated phospholipid phosphatase